MASFFKRAWFTALKDSLPAGRNRPHRKLIRQTQKFSLEQLEGRCVPTTLHGTISADTALTDTSEPYLIDGNLTILAGVTLTVGPNVTLQIQQGMQVIDNGTLTVTNAAAVIANEGGYSAFGITVNGVMNVTNTPFTHTSTYGSSSLQIGSGGHLTASGSRFAWSSIFLNSGSIDSIHSLVFGGPTASTFTVLTIDSGASISISSNDFSNLAASNGVVATGNPDAFIDLRNNNWGTTNTSLIETKILHHPDNTPATRPTVRYTDVLSVTTNANISALAGPQHARVASVVVTFYQPVNLDANAITLALHTNNVFFGGVAQPNGMGAVPTTVTITPNPDLVSWIVTFSGGTLDGPDGFRYLQEGVYDVVVDGSKAHPVAAPASTLLGNTTTFHTLYGDNDGVLVQNGNYVSASVDTSDNLIFRSAFNNPAQYQAYFDFDGDHFVNTSDNLQFRNRFNKPLTWSI